MNEGSRSSGSSSIVQRLTILVVLAVLPVVAFAGMMVLHFSRASEAVQQIQMQATARALSLAIDREVALQQATAAVLSGSRSLQLGDLDRFYQRAAAAVGRDRDRRVMLYGPDAHLILTTQIPFGAPLPQSTFEEPVRAVLQTGEPVVSDLGINVVTHDYVLGIYVPVFRNGAVRYVLVVGFEPRRICELLMGQHLPQGWIATATDRNGVLIGESAGGTDLVGRTANPDYRRQISATPEGTGESVGFNGTTIAFAHVRSGFSGWTVGMAVDKQILDAPLHAALWQIALGGSLLSLMAVGLAIAYGRTIAAPIGALVTAATALGRGERPPHLRLGMVEAQRVADALDAAAGVIEERGQEREAVLKTLEQRVAERTRELQESEAQLRQLATTDSLTALPNRRRFDEVFATTWRQALREQSSLSLLMIDADYFKPYNDRYGHEAGDACLQAIATAIESLVVRAGDFAARYGGEEFMVLLANTDPDGAITVAQRIHAAVLDLAIPHEGSPIGSVTVSIGTATATPRPREDRNELIRAADRNLYAAKRAGRSRIEAGQLV